MNGLLAVHRGGVPITIVVINNNGGGIFRRLPIAQHDPPFTDLFLTPHGLTFAPAAEMYGLRYVHVNTGNDFANAFRDAVGNVPTLIEVTTDSTVDENARRQIAAAFAQSRAQS
jgi:2-succinyl-5-enolpyruvyl-6-hydroxy-3-cyclohexene-1-carboxylate synthase